MNDLRAAAQQALKALDALDAPPSGAIDHYELDRRKQALRAALEQPEQEPVTWGVDWGRDGDRPCCTIIKRHADGTQEVVAVEYGPPRREWQGLSDDDIAALYVKWDDTPGVSMADFARAVEQALRSRNNG